MNQQGCLLSSEIRVYLFDPTNMLARKQLRQIQADMTTDKSTAGRAGTQGLSQPRTIDDGVL